MSAERLIARLKRVGFGRWIRGFGLILFAVILVRIDFRAVLTTLSTVDVKVFTVAALFLLPLTLIKSVRWGLFLDPALVISVKDRAEITLIGSYFGAVTLGRLGDFIRVMYLRNRGCSFGASVYSIFADKVCDLVATLLMGGVGWVLFVGRIEIGTLAVTGVAFVTCAVVVGSTVAEGIWLRRWLLEWVTAVIPPAVRGAVIDEARKFSGNLRRLSVRQVLLAGLLTAVFWILTYIRYDFVLTSLHADVSFFYTAMIVSVVQLVVLIPVSFLGVGTRDVTLIYLFGVLGLPADLAVSFSLMFLVMSLINAVCGYIVFLRYGGVSV